MLLDLRGLNCSLPVLLTREMLCLLAQRDRTVECTDPLADIDILPHETGDTLECREAANGLFFISSVEKHGAIFSPVARRCGGIPAPLAASVFHHGKPCQGVDRVAEDQNSKTPAFAPVRLRPTIKGISIAAITYYLLSIRHLIFEGLHRKIDAFDPVAAMAFSVPFVLALILWMFRRRGKPGLEVR